MGHVGLLRQSPAAREEPRHQAEGKRGRPAEEEMADEDDEDCAAPRTSASIAFGSRGWLGLRWELAATA
jgi:hypothetical protein